MQKKRFAKIIFVSLLLLLIARLNLIACEPDTSSHFADEDTAFTRSLITSFDYGSDKVFQGRTATTRQPYVAPSIAYEAPSGFFAAVDADQLQSPKKKWDEVDFNFGWGFHLFQKKLEFSIAYTRSFFGKQSEQVRSSLTKNLELALKKNFNDIVTTKLYYDYDYGNNNHDYGFTLDNYHDFIIENLFTDDNDELKIKPQVSITAGTLNFYKLHLKNAADKPSLQNIAVDVNPEFNFTSAEFSLPLEYDIGRFSLEPAIHYNIPLNQPKRLNAVPITYFTLSLGFAII